MHFEFEHLGSVSHFELAEGEHLLGGGEEDGVRLEGLPPRLLTLRVEGARLLVEATQPFCVEGVGVPPGVARLLLPGETLALPGRMLLRALPPAGTSRSDGTQALLRGLLREADLPPPSRAATLTCLTGHDLGRSFALAEDSQDLGRGAHVPLRLRDRTVSRAHARVRREAGGFWVEDLGSPNGLYVNGHRLRGEALLADGDVLELGQTLLRYQAPLEEAPPEPPPAEPVPVDGALPDGPLPQALDSPLPRRRALEGWLIGLGAALAVAGALVTYALTSG
jgi:hypothetical protein